MPKQSEILRELKSRSREELAKLLKEKHDQLWALVSDLNAGKVKNVREIKATKRTIARILTLMQNQPTA